MKKREKYTYPGFPQAFSALLALKKYKINIYMVFLTIFSPVESRLRLTFTLLPCNCCPPFLSWGNTHKSSYKQTLLMHHPVNKPTTTF